MENENKCERRPRPMRCSTRLRTIHCQQRVENSLPMAVQRPKTAAKYASRSVHATSILDSPTIVRHMGKRVRIYSFTIYFMTRVQVRVLTRAD
ncbi:unnamed protein product [Dovyalis caffra]|uniref:Uncharacterized protein n=1 Tax=Dovyalis caffra TaxID=77055 RepID=A0AAV1R402_9ROSI|nr:unnamed protein product [Dovyalis caffra]